MSASAGRRVDAAMGRAPLPSAVPTAVGSLPHDDVDEAVRAALDLHQELPAAPQLPNRSPAELMVPQVAAGMPGVAVLPDGTIEVDRKRVAPVPEGEPLDAAAWATALAFLDAARERRNPIKLQITGPVTLGLALVAAGVRASKAFAVADATVRSRISALLAEAAARCPDAEPVVVLDEPGMTAYLHDGFPLTPDDTIDLLSRALAATGPDLTAGIHCCGPTDWRLVLHAGPDLVSLPVEAATADDAPGFATFLDRGGIVAWGVVPTDRPLGDRDDVHWRRLTSAWCELSAGGCDPILLRTQSLLTPACGLARHSVDQVGHVFSLVRRVAERVQDQALAVRISAGA